MKLARSITLLLCLCALALRMTGMHLHVALDHQDAQHHVHVDPQDAHADQHPDHNTHDHDLQAAHLDAAGDRHIEVSLDSKALSKKPGALDIDALLFVAILLSLLITPRELQLPVTRILAPPIQRLIHLRPPLRGPPLHA